MNFIFIYLYSHDRMTGVEFIIEQRKFHYYIICLSSKCGYLLDMVKLAIFNVLINVLVLPDYYCAII